MDAPAPLAPEIEARLEALAAKCSWTREEMIADALINGHSLDWQEAFVASVLEGVAEADRGQFATQDDIQRVLNKYRVVA